MHRNLSISVTWYVLQITTSICVKPFNLDFRLHTWIAREPCAKLWYVLRALDRPACGYYEIPIELAKALTGGDEKTIYRWLQSGRSLGAFRRYKVRRGILCVWLGGLSAVCTKLNLKNWGAVAVVNLLDLGGIRALTTATATQFLQQKSRYAAGRKISADHRKQFGPPLPNEILGEPQSSLKMGNPGQVPFVLHVSDSKVFVSKSFAAFGTSQQAISRDLGIHQRTVQRHQVAAGMVKRQLCQKKVEYGWIKNAIGCEVESYHPQGLNSTGKSEGIGYDSLGDAIAFSDGFTPGARKSEPNRWTIPKSQLDSRLFRMGDNFWFAKCNIYREELTLTTMRAARKAHRAKVAQCQFRENCAVGQATDFKKVAVSPRT